jgi:glutamate-1-semialdehyde 2,1-aminomutase
MLGVRPDLTAFAKIIGGGLPVGAFGGRADIMELYAPERGLLPHSGTYNGNPVTMAAGLQAMALLTAEAYRDLAALGDRARGAARRALESAGIAGQVTGTASLLQIHFTSRAVSDYRSAAAGDKALNFLLHLSLLDHGVFTIRRGMCNLSTPMREADVEQFGNALAAALEEIRPAIAARTPDLLAA